LTEQAPHCEYCGDVIGVYERLVEVLDGIARETSRAAEPALSNNRSGSYFHAGCFRRLPQPVITRSRSAHPH
jgi:hypothetical protein